MLDLETLGTDISSAIRSISAVLFNKISGETISEFEVFIDVDDCIKNGMTVSWNTISWWLTQSEEARRSLVHQKECSLVEALTKFSDWYYAHPGTISAEIFGNGATFDISILKNAFTTVGLKEPWQFSKERDVRTVVDLLPAIKANMKFTGIPHNGIDDCKHQIKYVSEIYRTVTSALEKYNSDLEASAKTSAETVDAVNTTASDKIAYVYVHKKE